LQRSPLLVAWGFFVSKYFPIPHTKKLIYD